MPPRSERLTLRLSPSTLRHVEQIANRDGDSISAAAARLLEVGLAQDEAIAVPSLTDFREVRADLSRSLRERAARLSG